MNTETEQISHALMMLRGRFDGRLLVLAEKMGISKQRLSAYLNGAVPTKRIGRDILAIFAQEFPTETGPSTASESTPPCRVECEAKPIGYITHRGRDWSMEVPVYSDAARNDAVMRAAALQLSVARGEAGARIAAQADADGLEPFPQAPQTVPSR